jgi:hypothetical protein
MSQPFGRLGDVVAGQLHRQRAFLLDDRVEVLPLDELHHDEVRVAVVIDVVAADDVRVVE